MLYNTNGIGHFDEEFETFCKLLDKKGFNNLQGNVGLTCSFIAAYAGKNRFINEHPLKKALYLAMVIEEMEGFLDIDYDEDEEPIFSVGVPNEKQPITTDCALDWSFDIFCGNEDVINEIIYALNFCDEINFKKTPSGMVTVQFVVKGVFEYE